MCNDYLYPGLKVMLVKSVHAPLHNPLSHLNGLVKTGKILHDMQHSFQQAKCKH